MVDKFDVVELDSNAEVEEADRIELFRIDGVGYSIPVEISVSTQLEYMRMVRIKGEAIASGLVMEELVGEEGYNALINFKKMTTDQYLAITQRMKEIMMGATEAKKSTGPRKTGKRNGQK